jgi:hypothetical protein
LLLVLNDPLYRFLEGYPPFPGWLAEWLKKRKRRRLQSWSREIRTLHDEWAEQGSAFPAAKRDQYQRLRRDFVKSMPPLERYILPTRFGNAIRAFEVYPGEIYGADGVVIWLRLTSVISKTFGEQIQDIRSQIDFLVNCWFFSVIVALLGAARAIFSANWHNLDLHTTDGDLAFISSIDKFWLFWAAGGAIAAYLFYLVAVNRVPAWGGLVMSAFDCYLPALAEQLGFELPTTEAERRSFWETFSQQLIYRREPDDTTPFCIEKWKRAQLKTENKEAEGSAESQNGKAGESGGDNNSEDDPNPTEI